MTDALIGHTGFVGGHLAAQHPFPVQVNSRTIGTAAGGAFGTVVCAAAPGSMFEANRFPDQDAERIDQLIAQLATIRARHFILISSIAVLADPGSGQDEDTAAFQTDLAYGRNRRRMEEFCAAQFPSHLIVRLPALFGRGLKKNFLFDILNPMPSMLPEARFAELSARFPADLRDLLDTLYTSSPQTGMRVIDRAALQATGARARFDAAVTDIGMSAVQFTHPQTQFQYYDMTALWRDIGLARAAGLALLHLAPAPLEAAMVHAAVTGTPMPQTAARLHREDMRTRHAALWGREGPYSAAAPQVLEALRGFFASEREVA